MTPFTRTETYLARLCGADIEIPQPITRSDFYYAKLCGMDITIPMPITRTDMYLAKLCGMNIVIPYPLTCLDVYMAFACGMDLDIETPKPISRVETYWNTLAAIFNFHEELTGALPLIFESNGMNLIDYRIYGNSFQDGMPSPEQPIEVKSVGDKTKNLLPEISEKNGWTKGYLNNGGGCSKQDSIQLEMVSPYIKIEPDKQYTFSSSVNIEHSKQWTAMCFYDSEYNSIAQRIGGTGNDKETDLSPKNAYYCRVSLRTFNNVDYVQLEEGESATAYEPYGYRIPIVCSSDIGSTITTSIYLDKPLRKIGDYYDYIDYENKSVVRQISTHVYTGDEDFTVANTDGKRITVVFQINDSLINTPSDLLLNTHFEVNTTSQNSNVDYITTNREAWHGSERYYIPLSFFSELTKEKIISEWTTYIKNFYTRGTPVIVYYVLKEPVTETIKLPDIPTFTGTDTLNTDTNIKPSQMYVKYSHRISADRPS